MEGQSSTTLSPEGRLQAQQLAQRMVLPQSKGLCASVFAAIDRPTHLYSSPLLRAKQTAQYLSTALQRSQHPFKAVEDPHLKEIHQGIFQGLTWPEAQAKYPDLCAQLMSTPRWQPVPGAESPQDVRARSQHWFAQILDHHQPGETLWAVSHAGFMMHLISAMSGQRVPWKAPIAHTATFEFWFSLSSSDASQSDTLISKDSSKSWRLHAFHQVYRGSLATSVSESS